ncbi:MAG: succinylglutamate desuccinylase/aspartoacylase family protein [Lentisphaeraceae bacterium]|nr:succinylglutamate desuccinylase/aspartoacylase family protein [Lentisphaeraceae bacterium]
MAKSTSDALWKDVPLSSRKEFFLEIAESYTGINIRLPLQVWKGKKEGPTLFVSAAVHGDEINGTGTIRELIANPEFELECGTLVMIPVVNIQGFERHTRYMPDRRDLNRYFPGVKTGSVTSRLADVIYREVICHCDYGIDLHTASVRRTNFPHVRADMEDEKCKMMAEAFGTEVVLNSSGPEGSLRYEATKAGCSTIVLEAGEVWKVETAYVETATRGIVNVLKAVGMVAGEFVPTEHQIVCETTKWLRAQSGGFLQFHVSPGETLVKGQKISTNTGLLGKEIGSILAPCHSIIIGMSTMPAVSPGDAVVHVALSTKKDMKDLEDFIDNIDDESIEGRTRDDFATNIHVIEENGD